MEELKTNEFLFEGQANPTSKRIYDEANEIIEKCTKIMYFISVKVSWPGVVIPIAIYSFYNYFTTDLGFDAFRMPFAEW